jgi:hypothetical protein
MSGGRRLPPPRYDGPPSAPSSTGEGGSARRPSNAGSHPGSNAPPGPHGPPSRPGSSQGMRPRLVDPALEHQPRMTDICRNADLPGAAYLLDNMVSFCHIPSLKPIA